PHGLADGSPDLRQPFGPEHQERDDQDDQQLSGTDVEQRASRGAPGAFVASLTPASEVGAATVERRDAPTARPAVRPAPPLDDVPRRNDGGSPRAARPRRRRTPAWTATEPSSA